MLRRYFSVLLLLLLFTLTLSAEEAPTSPFHFPELEGWRSETLPFPLVFAPDLAYEGFEELRFAPGMFDPQLDGFWSYAFLWWIEPGARFDAATLSSDLETYFRGLSAAVAERNELELVDPVFEAQLQEVENAGEAPRTLTGTVDTVDVFATQEPVKLQVRITLVPCEQQKRLAVLFELSPKPASHPIWDDLSATAGGFRCTADSVP